jgi:prepilin-type N-terminal cleavage/methylation domain-containing protein
MIQLGEIRAKALGFTLIELLVVISIIGILASIISISASRIRAQARDSRRISDLKVIASGIEIYFAQYKLYPYPFSCATSLDNQPWIRLNDPPGSGGTNVTSQYFPGATLPRDPRNNATYRYQYCSTNGSTYTLSAPLETNHSELRNDPIPNNGQIYDIIP